MSNERTKKMNNERRKYPRVSLGGEASILLSGVVRNGVVMNLSPSGIQLECHHQLVDQLSKAKSDAGLYPEFELEFTLPGNGKKIKAIKSTCNVSYCRRQNQDSYHLGLNFITLNEHDEQKVSDYISHAEAA